MRRFWIVIALAAAAAAAAALLLQRRGPDWTTDSPEALAEFRRGLEAESKYYRSEAVAHYQRARELDPGFAMATLKLLAFTPRRDKEASDRLAAELRATDVDRLNERERFLVGYRLAHLDREHARAEKLLTAYLESHPDDPHALQFRCAQAWDRRDWPEADRCMRRLLAVDPNWMQAQNHLGYVAMAQGRFAEAEELFRTYLYVAPDQANPHDSLGELLILLGRYDEAERELQAALKIRQDFCESWAHLISLYNLRGDTARAEATLAELEEQGACPREVVRAQRCRVELWRHIGAKDWSGAWDAMVAGGCLEEPGEVSLLAQRAALRSGRRAEALAMEEQARALHEKYRQESGEPERDDPALAYLQGVRLAEEGSWAEAAAAFRTADQELVYWGDGHGLFKLFNRLDLARALERGGDEAGARALLDEVAKVNPDLARRWGPAIRGAATAP